VQIAPPLEFEYKGKECTSVKQLQVLVLVLVLGLVLTPALELTSASASSIPLVSYYKGTERTSTGV